MTDGPLLWFLNRGTGAAVLVLLTATVALGILTGRPIRSRWIPGFVTRQLHRNIAVIATVLVLLHALSAVVDTYVDIRWWQVISPVGATYRPFWLGLGSLALDIMLVVALSSALRARLTPRVWRAIHLSGYLTWPVALVHSYGTGTDSKDSWARWLALSCAAAIVLAATARLRSERRYDRELRSVGVLS